MIILVTGATGFLGRHLVDELTSKENKVIEVNSKVCDLRNTISDDHVINNIKYDKIYHLAVDVKAGTYNIHHKGDTWLNNSLINLNIIDFWLRNQKEAQFCTMGTSCAYSPGSAMNECNYLNGHPDLDLYGYAISKRSMLWGLMAMKDQYDMDYQYFIPSTLCGPNFDEHDNHFQFDFIKKIAAAKYEHKDVEFWGHGLQKREILDVEDAVDIITSVDIKNTAVNLSTGKEYTLREYADIVCKIIDYPASKIKWDGSKWMGVPSKNLVNSYLQDYNFTSIEDTFAKSIEYYLRVKYGK